MITLIRWLRSGPHYGDLIQFYCWSYPFRPMVIAGVQHIEFGPPGDIRGQHAEVISFDEIIQKPLDFIDSIHILKQEDLPKED